MIVILGVLAAVVVFAVGGITDKGKSSACKIEVRTVNTATQAFYAAETYPDKPKQGRQGVAHRVSADVTGLNLCRRNRSASAPVAFAGTYDAGHRAS